MSLSDSRLSDDHDPMAIVSDDEIVPEPEISTFDEGGDPEMMSDDDDDFQPFALPDLGDDLPTTDGIPDEDPFVIPTPVHDHLIIDHPNGEHFMAPILTPDPLVAIPLEDFPFDDLFDIDADWFLDGPFDNAHGDEKLDEDIAVGLRRYATDSYEETAKSAALIPPHDFEPGLELNFIPVKQPVDTPADPEPIPATEPLPDHDPVPFGIPNLATLIPDLVPATVDPPVVDTIVPPPAPALRLNPLMLLLLIPWNLMSIVWIYLSISCKTYPHLVQGKALQASSLVMTFMF
ncbi:hypothetical protein Hdeb2414_s0003g00095721 [Helianthus debilis subsp. tardiflorus]